MSLFVGAKLSCDRERCGWSVTADSEEKARRHAESDGWSRVGGSRDYCPSCTERRAERPKLADLLPSHTLMAVLNAARAAGFSVRKREEGDDAEVTCCGEPVSVEALIGPYFAKCKQCGAAIADAAGPSFGSGSVALMDSEKVDFDDGKTWYVVEPEPNGTG